MKGWEVRKLGEAVKDVSTGPFGSILHEKDYVENGIPLVNPINIVDGEIVADLRKTVSKITAERLSSYRLQDGDVVVARRGDIGRCAVVSENETGWLCGTGSFFVRSSGKIVPHYLANLLRSPEYRLKLEQSSSGTTMKNLSNSALKDLAIPLPPLDEQRRIVAVLDEAFAGLAVMRANAEANLANARALFDSHLNAIFSQKGEGWVEKRVGEVSSHCLGKMLDKNKNKGNPQPYLRNINVRWFEFDLNDVLEMKIEPSEEARYSAIKGDLLICEGGYPGRAAIWESDEPIFFQKAIHRVRFKNPGMAKWLLYFLYLSDRSGTLRENFTGSGIQHFTGQALAKFVIPIPPEQHLDELLKRFDQIFATVSDLESLYRQKLATIDELKQSLLQKAFAGELTSDHLAA